MANLRNAIKRIRRDKKKTIHNLKIREDLTTLIKKAKKAIEKKEAKAAEMIATIQKMSDKAVQHGIIKRNTASRNLSRLMSLKNRTK